jgi:hypothetical protein
MTEGNSAPESVVLNPEVTDSSTAVDKSPNTGKVTRRSFIAGGLAAIAGLFGRKSSEANAATPPQNMVAGSEKVLGDPGQRMTANAELVRDRGSEMANNQLDVQATPPQNMVASTEDIRQEPGGKMADATLDIKSKDFAGSQERVQDRGSEMAHDQETVRMEPGAQMAADQEDTRTKDFAGNAERVQDEDNSGGNDSNTETPSPEIPPADEALV